MVQILQREGVKHLVSKHSTSAPTLTSSYLWFRYCTHLAGALAGLLLGVALLDNRREENWEKTLIKVSLPLYFILLLTAVLWHIVS